MSFDVSADSGEDAYNARVLLSDDPDDEPTLARLRADPRTEFIDRSADFDAALRALRPAVEADVLAEPMRWAHYPWRHAVMAVPAPRAFHRLRLDRNRNMITLGEQQRLAGLTIGVVGLSVGHAIAHTLAAQGLCGELRLADFDELELSNLNRVPATVFDIGVNKAVVAARRVAELDPYLTVRTMTDGLTMDTMGAFLDGLDIVVEECDSLDIKAAVREAARARRIPVLMASSDRGLIDVERYDLEPERPILHGLLGDIGVAELAGLSSTDKVPHVLRIIDAGRLSDRGAASLVEVGRTLSTWPQLAGDIAVGAATVAEAVRRIGLGERLPSGRVRIDVARALDGIEEPALPPEPVVSIPAEPTAHADSAPADAVAAAARRAPSGGNMQPWNIVSHNDSVIVELDPKYTSTMDVAYRASAVAIGAATFNARVAAAALGVLGPVTITEGDDPVPLRAVVELAEGHDDTLAALYGPMLERGTNRHRGTPAPLTAASVADLDAAARAEGGALRLLTDRADMERAAAILAATDRIRYLQPRLHAEMISEVRWPGDDDSDGLDIRGLELANADMATLDILRRGDVMARLAQWNAGAALGQDVTERVLSSSALGVVTVVGRTLTDYACAGAATEAVWIAAQQLGLGVQPVSPVFLYAHDDRDLDELAAEHVEELRDLQAQFRALTGTDTDEAQALVLRFSHAPSPSVRSRRRTAGRGTLG
ncbi:molybdopterin/thiamine biosynthesis adenylyltransferase [Mycolicibacterium sp. BK634]|uniref:Rv1355c family protein n=1 Tax=Mycolicibacterium sp. BK634 TaxID=2587099 RepID=UPI00162090CD|nr:molybdopterin/thiamine biosynthesis adenylyltransferase [Mycolicibacterium sp. BK634]